MRSANLLAVCVMITRTATAQVSYVVDNTAFSALTAEGGKVQARFFDIDQDGHRDLITVGDHGSPLIGTNQHGISVFFGNGTGTGWVLYQNGNFGYGGIDAGDLNNDGLMDVAYGMHHNYNTTDFGDQLIEAALGDGTGMNWTPWDDSLATAGETYGMFGTELGDLDEDGWLDIASGSFGCCAGTHVYLNKGTGEWHHSFGYINGNTEKYPRLGDLNHDGHLDLATCHQFGGVYFGDGNGGFTLAHHNLPTSVNFGCFDVSLGDLDNDGDDEIALVAPGTWIPQVYRWNDATTTWVSMSTGLPTSGTWFVSRLADLDADGFLDLVVVGNSQLVAYKGNGGSSWASMYSVALPNFIACQDLAIADVDHNGKPEIMIWADYSTGTFSHSNQIKLLRETTVASALSISALYPSGEECLPAGAVGAIEWNSAVPGGHASSVRIDLSISGAGGPWLPITLAAPDNGAYQWTVPGGTISTDCYLRLIATDSVTLAQDTAITPAAFQIGICDLNVVVSNHTITDAITLTPNPAPAWIEVAGGKAMRTITILDADGRTVEVFHVEGRNGAHLPVADLLPAMYLARIQFMDGTVVNRRWVKR